MPVPSFKPKKTIEAIQSDIASAKQGRDIWASYDKFDDKSTVYCKADSTLFFIFTFKGRTLLAEPKTFFIQADSTDAKDELSYSTRLQFIADNERIELKAVDYKLSGNIAELKRSVYFIATPQIVEKIANAKILDYRVGTFENNLVNSERNKIKIFLSLSTPY